MESISRNNYQNRYLSFLKWPKWESKPLWLNWENFSFVVAVLVMLLFTYTAVSKALDYNKFVFQMRLVPVPLMHNLAPIIGWSLPIVELTISVFLLTERFRQHALKAALLLMVAFEVYIILMLASGLDLPCTCGGLISKMSWPVHLIFNGVIILLLALAVTFQDGKSKGKIK